MATQITRAETAATPEATREVVSYDPATGEEIGRVPLLGAEEVEKALARARAAQKGWGALSFRERARVVMRARAFVLEEMDEIARLIARESGKPAAEALAMEIVPTLDLMQFFARRTARLLRPEKVDIGLYRFMGRTSTIEYRPLGVVAVVSPWNFPWAIPLGEVVMALMAGNAVVHKPSELTPLVALKIGDVFARAGLPAGLLEIVTGDGSTGAALTEAGADKIMFTGSVSTGRRVAEAAARKLIPVVLELGGKDPLIVFEDADLDAASSAAVWGAFANSGQACASVERCYVHESIADDFTARVVEKVRALRQAVGTEEGVDLGAMSSERQLRTVEEHLREAVARGARVVAGGGRPRGLHEGGAFHEPTVLTGVDHSMTVMREETFGPVLPIMTFKDEDEAVRLANDSPFGLTASVWTRNIRRGRRVASRVEAGTVMVNEVLYTHGIAQTPWGGVKQSGLGRTHGRLGLLELVAPHHVHVNRLAVLQDVWWFNYTPGAASLFRSLARRFATGSLLQAALLSPQMLRRLRERHRRKP
ncbi:MAG TPA: aldehyde dehydrogenase family protein [Pyrinomonadaceae bacterium]|jgi:succinate-semialdehyde dehydrogenase/glutarate-semialdehyde dehydrogenase|nr:aldehyde dehydrogenase family protein [Pyrinomonadaceae bacterium]